MFLLFASESSALMRVEKFQSSTSIATLFFYPFILSSLMAIIYPWINYAFLYLCQKPTNLRNLIQAEAEHALLVKKQELEEERLKLASTKETALIERANRDKQIEEIEDVELRKKTKAEIESIRAQTDGGENIDNRHQIQNDLGILNQLAEKYRRKASDASYSVVEQEEFKIRAKELEEKIYEKENEILSS